MKTSILTLALGLAFSLGATSAAALDDLAKCRVYNAKIKMNYAKCLELDKLLVEKGKAPKGICESKRTTSLDKARAKFVDKLGVSAEDCGIDTATTDEAQALQLLASSDDPLTTEQEAALAGTAADITSDNAALCTNAGGVYDAGTDTCTVDITTDNAAAIAAAMPSCQWGNELWNGAGDGACVCAIDTDVRDCSGTCGGDDIACVGCDGVPNSGLELDACNVCGGPGLNADGCCGVETKDCSGTCGGTQVEDCTGACGGSAVVDCFGNCDGGAVEDCAGTCGGTATWADCAEDCPDSITFAEWGGATCRCDPSDFYGSLTCGGNWRGFSNQTLDENPLRNCSNNIAQNAFNLPSIVPGAPRYANYIRELCPVYCQVPNEECPFYE